MSNSKRQKNSQSEVSDFFSKLNSWMEESQRQFSNLVNSHSTHITKGFNELDAEVGQLHAELSAIKKERAVLLETVSHLNSEIRQQKDNLSGVHPPLRSRGNTLIRVFKK